MNPRPVVLLLGATGFIGSRILNALERAGYTVRGVSRKTPVTEGWVQGDLQTDVTPEVWVPRLEGVHTLINAAGAFTGESLSTVHAVGPEAVFRAAAHVGVARIIQISALGADTASTNFFATKNQADRTVMSLPVASTILRPSLVFGAQGRSATMLMMLATMPLIPLPRAFEQRVQPVHIDDLVQAVVMLVSGAPAPANPLPVVGDRALSLRDLLATLRRQLGFPTARFLSLPDWTVRVLSRLPPLARRGYLSEASLRMLAVDNTASSQPLADLLGRPPRAPDEFIPPQAMHAMAMRALLAWILPPLRWSIAALWIWSGLVSLGLYPVQNSYALLARTDMPASVQPVALYGAAALDILLGLLVLWMHRQIWIWRIQIVVIVAYTLIISVWLPEFWLHPYGPVIKNLPLLGMLYLLQQLASRPWNTSL